MSDGTFDHMEAERLFEEGQRLYDAGKREEAGACFSRAAAIAPDWPEAIHRLASYWMDAGIVENATPLLKKLVRLDPDNSEAHWMLGEAALTEDKPVSAIAHLRRALSADPYATEPKLSLARALHEAGRQDESRELFDEILSDDPASAAEAHLGIARLLYEEDRIEDMDAHLAEAIDADPMLPAPHLMRALSLSLLDRPEEARASCLHAISLAPEDPVAHFNLGRIESGEGNNDAALAAFQKALDLAPDYVPARFAALEMLHQFGRSRDALACANEGLDDDAEEPGFHFHRGVALHALGRGEEALTSYREALRLEPDSPEALMNMSLVLMDLGRKNLAVAASEKASKLAPDNVETKLGLARAYRASDRDADALNAALQAQHEHPDSIEPLRLLTELALDEGNFELAAQHLQRALDLAPDDPEIWVSLGDCERQMGRYEKATAALRRALEIAPDRTAPRRLLAITLAEANRLDEAATEFARCCAEQPDDADNWLEAGRFEHNRGDLALALEKITRATALRAGDPEILAALSLTLAASGNYEQALDTSTAALRRVPDDELAFAVAYQILIDIRFFSPRKLLQLSRSALEANGHFAQAHEAAVIANAVLLRLPMARRHLDVLKEVAPNRHRQVLGYGLQFLLASIAIIGIFTALLLQFLTHFS